MDTKQFLSVNDKGDVILSPLSRADLLGLDLIFSDTTLVADNSIDIIASENLQMGDFVNIWSDLGYFRVRKSTAYDINRIAMAYVSNDVIVGEIAHVLFDGTNNFVAGVVPGPLFLGGNGRFSASPPTDSGTIIQRVGTGVGPNMINVEFSTPILRS